MCDILAWYCLTSYRSASNIHTHHQYLQGHSLLESPSVWCIEMVLRVFHILQSCIALTSEVSDTRPVASRSVCVCVCEHTWQWRMHALTTVGRNQQRRVFMCMCVDVWVLFVGVLFACTVVGEALGNNS